MAEYALSCELRGHTSDVRCVAAIGADRVATGSRDKTIKVWRHDGGAAWHEEAVLVGHTHFVGALVWLDARGVLVSGSNDRSLRAWDVDAGECTRELTGHEDAVVCVAGSSTGGAVLSGSWDNTARVWDAATGACTAVLRGHTAAVWAVRFLSDAVLATGSADTTIRVWRGEQCLKVIAAHTQAVRALTTIKGVGFVSCSNDGAIKTWNAKGNQIDAVAAHDSFVYSVLHDAAHNALLSTSEDGSLRVHTGHAQLQSVAHPGTVWHAAQLPSGDVVTACEDGVVRVWTRDAARRASDEAVAALAAAVGAQQAAVAAELARKETLHGQQYDRVFTIATEEGAELKLGYDMTQDPYDVASDFVEQHELSLAYVEQIANHIITQTGGNAGSGVGGGGGGGGGGPTVATHFPAVETVYFHSIDAAGVSKSLRKCNAAVDAALRLSAHELDTLDTAIGVLNAVQAYPPPEISSEAVLAAAKALRWPPACVFPALDLVRQLVLFQDAALTLMGSGTDVLGVALAILRRDAPSLAEHMLALRIVSNMCAGGPFRSRIADCEVQAVMVAAARSAAAPNAAVRLSYATLLFNVSTMARAATAELDQRVWVVEEVGRFLAHERAPEPAFRALVALGNVVGDNAAVARLAAQMGLPDAVRPWLASTEEKVRVCAADLMALWA